MPEFFLELFSEEIPARMQQIASEHLYSAVLPICHVLDPGTEPKYPVPELFCGPRRLAISATVGAERAGQLVEIRGPRTSAPEAALAGFLKKHDADKNDLLKKNGYYLLRRQEKTEPAREYIERVLPELIAIKIEWLKAMRWSQSGDFAWIRPLRRAVCLLDGEILPIKIGPVVAGNVTEGHRVMSARPFSVSSARQWKDDLRSNFVIASFDERADIIATRLSEEAAKLRLLIVKDEILSAEVPGLVDWPVPLIGRIDPEFMGLPSEVRELSMKVNQKYFALRSDEGKPAPYFAFVANLEAPDGGAAIIAGNERVLRARLSDARYFYDLDLKTPLDELIEKLEKVTFHGLIGDQAKRADRLSMLSREIAEVLGADGDQDQQARWAGWLCKADLVTGMVGEFPELQGIMGGYYAERNPRGWDGAVVGPAIRTHYQPKGPRDAVPTGVVAASVALADKIDTLVEFFRIGETPTGSGDPYALRRAALGVIRIILENELRLPLRPLLGGDGKLFNFIIERLRVKLRNDGLRFDVLDAVMGAGTDDDLLRVMQRVAAVTAFLQTADGGNLLTAYRRAANILRIEDGKDGPHRGEDLRKLSGLPEELALADALEDVRQDTVEDFRNGHYAVAMAALAQLRGPVDAFFDKVTVNAAAPEVRLNRLRLLALLRDTMHRIADFSRIEG